MHISRDRSCLRKASVMTTRPLPARTVKVTLPRPSKPEFKQLGGSDSDYFNQMLANQTLGALWIAHSDDEERNRQFPDRPRNRSSAPAHPQPADPPTWR